MGKSIIAGQCLLNILGVLGFLCGYFFNIQWLMLSGGILVVVDDIVSIVFGILNPIFPIIFAALLAYLFNPWYIGVFWASTAFAILDIPTSFFKLLTLNKTVSELEKYID